MAVSSASAGFVTFALKDLRLGLKLPVPIYDGSGDDDILLLNRGIRLTEAAIDGLRRRGVTSVRVDARYASRVKQPSKVKPAAEAAPTVRTADEFGDREFSPDAVALEVKRSRDRPPAAEELTRYADAAKSAETRVKAIFDSLVTSGRISGAGVRDVTDGTYQQLVSDFDLFVRLGLRLDETDGAESMHAIRTARLAMAMGVVAGLNREKALNLGMGCMLADAGMAAVSEELRTQPRRLSPLEFLEITKHPGKTFDMLQGCDEIPVEARMVAYQINERWDGSGYPRRRAGKQIHPLARLAMVADVFVALVSPRPWRPALLGPAAIRQVLDETRAGRFEPSATRALVETIGVFPIGTWVDLSDGRAAQVMAVNPKALDRPLVEAHHIAGAARPAEMVNLAEAPRLRIVAVRASGLAEPDLRVEMFD